MESIHPQSQFGCEFPLPPVGNCCFIVANYFDYFNVCVSILCLEIRKEAGFICISVGSFLVTCGVRWTVWKIRNGRGYDNFCLWFFTSSGKSFQYSSGFLYQKQALLKICSFIFDSVASIW